MSDLISRSALLKEMKWKCEKKCKTCSRSTFLADDEHCGLIDDQPTIEAAPVVHGEVVTVFEKAIGHQRCSVCGNELEWKAYPNYCDNCGAKLKGGAE